MYVRVNILKFSSKIDADAMRALAKYEMINKLKGLLSIEVIEISDTNSVAILKFTNKEDADNAKPVYIEQMKKNHNIKVEIHEGQRDFIVEKS